MSDASDRPVELTVESRHLPLPLVLCLLYFGWCANEWAVMTNNPAVSGQFSPSQRDMSCEKADVLVGRRQTGTSGRDKLPGQGDLNGVTILIKHIQS